MKKTSREYFVSQSFVKVANAGSKPSSDFEEVLRKCGFKGLGLKSVYTSNVRYWWIRNWVSATVAQMTMPKDSTIVFQYPEQRHLGKLVAAAKRRGNKILFLVHDINELRGFPNNHPEWLRLADAVIAHSPAMQSWLEKNYGVENSVSLGVFDYITDNLPVSERKSGNRTTVVFAGRLDKSGFITKMCEANTGIDFIFFGPGFPEKLKTMENVRYQGVCAPEELPGLISKYDYGLVWDGGSLDGCDGPTGNYVRYNSPYKISSYLAAGLPVIVWKDMAVAEFVTDSNTGIALESLSRLSEKVNEMSAEDYTAMHGNVERIRSKLTSGGFYKDALEKALDMI